MPDLANNDPSAELLRAAADVAADIRATEQRFRATFEQAAVGMAHIATDGRWLLVNDKITDILGYSRDELMALTFQDVTHPDDLSTDVAGHRGCSTATTRTTPWRSATSTRTVRSSG